MAVGGLGLVLTTTLMSIAMTPSRVPGAPPVEQAAAWTAHVTALDTALEVHDLPAAQRAWQAAYSAALASRRWEALAEVADAHQRLTAAAQTPGAPRARALYLEALFRARDAGARDGVLRVATAFDELGDREVAAHARRMAGRLP